MKDFTPNLQSKTLYRIRHQTRRALLTSALIISSFGMIPYVLAAEQPSVTNSKTLQLSTQTENYPASSRLNIENETERFEVIKQAQQTDLPPLSNDLELSKKVMTDWLEGVEDSRSKNERRLKIRREDLKEQIEKFDELELLRDEVSVEMGDVVIPPVISNGSVEAVISIKVTNNTPTVISQPEFYVTFEPLRAEVLETQLWQDGYPDYIMDVEQKSPIPQGQDSILHLKVKMYVPKTMTEMPNGDWSPVVRSFLDEDKKSQSFSGLQASAKSIARLEGIIEKCETLLGQYDGFVDDAEARIAALYEPGAKPDYEKFPSLRCYP